MEFKKNTVGKTLYNRKLQKLQLNFQNSQTYIPLSILQERLGILKEFYIV